MLGIITSVKRRSCDVWAKNFPPLTFINEEDFGLTSRYDLREMFAEGDRVTFQASFVGCGVGGVSDVQAVDRAQQEMLNRARATIKKQPSITSATTEWGSKLETFDESSTKEFTPPKISPSTAAGKLYFSFWVMYTPARGFASLRITTLQ